MTAKIIEIRNATVYRGNTKVFENLSLEINRGDNTAIVGPNGAGKTTLLKLLSQELYPAHSDDSYVRILGRERWNVWDLRSHLGIVSYDLQHQYAGHVRGIDVALSGHYSSVGIYRHQEFSSQQIEQAQKIMAKLEIANLQDKLFASMSIGQQRRLLLARALVNRPHTLVLDEPTTSLDLKGTFIYLNIVRKLMQAGNTIILITHHLHDIPPEVTQVILLKHGYVVAQGNKQEILTDEALSELFEIPIKVIKANEYYQAVPATS